LDSDLEGLAGYDSLSGSAIGDDINGGAGDDTLNGGNGGDTLTGGANPSAPPDTDIINGGANDDEFQNSVGPDTYNGGSGADEVDYSTITTPGSANITAQIPSSVGGAGPGCPSSCDGDTIGADIENLTGDDGDDFLVGSNDDVVPNVLSGGDGNDQLRGGSAPGNDGPDQFFGGSGHDIASYVLQTADLVVDIDSSPDDPNGDNVELSIEELRGGQGDDTLTGDDDSTDGDTLNGGFGDDTLQGNAAVGADDGDVFIGGENSEDEGGDTVTYATRTSPVTVAIGTGANDGGGPCPLAGCEGDTVGAEIENLIGSAAGDTLVGDGGANDFLGGAGDDTMRGGQGTGADGADSFNGGTQVTAGDTVSYENRSDGVIAAIAPSILFPASDGDVIASNVDNLVGSSGNDLLGGDDSINTLDGRGGDDSLFGDQGATAGDLADTFVGGSNGAAGDTVSYANLNVEVTAQIGETPSTGDGAGGCPGGGGCEEDDIQGDVENLLGSSVDDDLLGDDGANRLDGREGDDDLTGHAVLTGTPDVGDTLVGGTSGLAGGQNGDLGDLANYSFRAAPVTASIGDGANDGTGAEGDDVQGDVERLRGGLQGDNLTGNEAANQIFGFMGNDVITGGAGQDDLRGEQNVDTVNARDGEDDAIDCGSETPDVAELDLLTLDDPATGCETVNRAQFVPPPTGGGAPAAVAGPTGLRAAALKKCKKKKTARAKKKCRKKARKLPV
jgi:Ca2+-binding RTX toxin-like protein